MSRKLRFAFQQGFQVKPENVAWAAGMMKKAAPHLKESDLRAFIFEESERCGFTEAQAVRAFDLYDAEQGKEPPAPNLKR